MLDAAGAQEAEVAALLDAERVVDEEAPVAARVVRRGRAPRGQAPLHLVGRDEQVEPATRVLYSWQPA